MNQESVHHLTQISTVWTILFQAHEGSSEEKQLARSILIQTYGPAVFRYLLGSVRNQEIAEELYQEYALRLVRGDFHRAQPDRGRFRDFLKTTLFHLIVDYQRQKKKSHLAMNLGLPEPTDNSPPLADFEVEFYQIWRAELLNRAWDGLLAHEQQTGQPLCTVLRLRADHPDWKAPQMAEHLTAQLEKEKSASWVRKQLHFARKKFMTLLLKLLSDTLENPSPEILEQELIELDLQKYCRITCSSENRSQK